jgi:IclR family transcriptional regulator, acetate operon repressor
MAKQGEGRDGPHRQRGTTTEDQPVTRNNSSSLRRALALLDYLATAEVGASGVSLAEFAAGTGLNRSTVLRLLAPLEEFRLVEQDAATKHWRLGPHIAYLGQVYLERLDLRRVAHPALQELARSTGETAHLVVLDVPEVVYIDKVESESSVRMISRIGARQPAYSTGVGKAFLAFGPEEAVAGVVVAGLPARTPRTITDEASLRAELDRIRSAGYAVDDVENEADIRCVAAPVFGATGAVTASLSVAGPSSRVSSERVDELAVQVRRAADQVTDRLGGRGPLTTTSGQRTRAP